MSSSGLPQGFSIYQPGLGALLEFFPAVGTRELDELIHAYIIGPDSSAQKRALLTCDFAEYSRRTGETFKFYPVYNIAASPATSASSSFNTSPTNASWDWSQSQTPRTASVSSRSSQHRVSKPTSPASRLRATDFSSLPGMKIMTKDGIDVTNSASRGSKTKEQRDHAHLMRMLKACESCKRKKIRCDPSHKKRAAATTAAPAAATAKVTKKARTSSPSAPSQTISPPQSASSQSVSPSIMMEELGSLSASPFESNPFSFDPLDSFDPTPAPHPWDEFLQCPPTDQPEEYDFFNDPASFFSSQSSDADLSAARLSASDYSPRSGAPPGRGPDAGRAEAHAELLDAVALSASAQVSAQLPYELQDSSGDYTDFNLFSPASNFSEDERMLDIASSTGLSAQSIPSPTDSPRRPPNVKPSSLDTYHSPSRPPNVEPSDLGTNGANAGGAAQQPPFTRAEETEPSERTNVRDRTAGGIAGALGVLSRVVNTQRHPSPLQICCPPDTVVVNGSGHGSPDTSLVNGSAVNGPRSPSVYIPRDPSELEGCHHEATEATKIPMETVVAVLLDPVSDGQTSQVAVPGAASTESSPAQLIDTLENDQPSRFVHRNTDNAQVQPVVLAASSPIDAAASNDGSTESSTGSPALSAEPVFGVSQTAASALSQRDTTTIHSKPKTSNRPRINALSDMTSLYELAVMMQTPLSGALLVAAHAQLYAQSTACAYAKSTHSRACRELVSRARHVLVAPTRVPAVC